MPEEDIEILTQAFIQESFDTDDKRWLPRTRIYLLSVYRFTESKPDLDNAICATSAVASK
jgi:hypothetical protein